MILYEICIWLAWFIDRKERKREAEEEEERMARLLAAPGPATKEASGEIETREEFDPALKEEGEEEDVSDPWDEDDK